MRQSLRSDLTAADPVAGAEDPRLRDLVRRMASDARDETAVATRVPKAWWKRRRNLIPMGIGGAIALTGAAVVIPLNMGIDGAQVRPDALIPISYTTDTGVDVHCRYGIYFGDPGDRSAAAVQLAAFVEDHDWTGIGQRVYDRAIANPFVPGRDGGLDEDTPQRRDEMSLMNAISASIEAEIPDHLRTGDPATEVLDRGITDCKGQLR
jgi:hypothetical protein